MARRIMKIGLVGMIFGFGLGLAATGESRHSPAKASPEAMDACYLRALKSAPDIYGIRALGRSEAWQTGAGISGEIQDGANLAAQESLYELRTIGRAEARQIDRFMDAEPGERGGTEIVADAESSPDIYELRSLGRGEAYGTGTDFCKLAPTEPTEVSLR